MIEGPRKDSSRGWRSYSVRARGIDEVLLSFVMAVAQILKMSIDISKILNESSGDRIALCTVADAMGETLTQSHLFRFDIAEQVGGNVRREPLVYKTYFP
jgi:hypothetical protein